MKQQLKDKIITGIVVLYDFEPADYVRYKESIISSFNLVDELIVVYGGSIRKDSNTPVLDSIKELAKKYEIKIKFKKWPLDFSWEQFAISYGYARTFINTKWGVFFTSDEIFSDNFRYLRKILKYIPSFFDTILLYRLFMVDKYSGSLYTRKRIIFRNKPNITFGIVSKYDKNFRDFGRLINTSFYRTRDKYNKIEISDQEVVSKNKKGILLKGGRKFKTLFLPFFLINTHTLFMPPNLITCARKRSFDGYANLKGDHKLIISEDPLEDFWKKIIANKKRILVNLHYSQKIKDLIRKEKLFYDYDSGDIPYPKINILFRFQQGPGGGGNQFLKALKAYFIKRQVYEEDAKKADIILFNSHHNLMELLRIKKKDKHKVLIHRVDGPLFLYRGDLEIDKTIYLFNLLLSDGTIFQSNWSKTQNFKLGLSKNNYETTIINAPDSKIFNQENRIRFSRNRKIKLIATSWSSNFKKGFEIYRYLDENLDFSKYDLSFVGNSPIEFKNIKQVKPLSSEKLAGLLKHHDIFITASQNDPCSNSLIEALHCGLPAIVYNDGGHPEIVNKAGEVFNSKEDILEKIDKVTNNYEYYQTQINLPTLDEVGKIYYNFIEKVYKDLITNKYNGRKIEYKDFIQILMQTYYWKVKLYILKKRGTKRINTLE